MTIRAIFVKNTFVGFIATCNCILTLRVSTVIYQADWYQIQIPGTPFFNSSITSATFRHLKIGDWAAVPWMSFVLAKKFLTSGEPSTSHRYKFFHHLDLDCCQRLPGTYRFIRAMTTLNSKYQGIFDGLSKSPAEKRSIAGMILIVSESPCSQSIAEMTYSGVQRNLPRKADSSYL